MSPPLVSVIVRSVDRPELATALASIAAQAYPAVEVVLVDAGGDHGPAPQSCGPFPVHVASQGRRLRRGQAANLGLEQARGRYLIFLDDDDHFLAGHIERLAAALQANPGAQAAYAGVRIEGEDGVVIDTYDAAFAPVELFAFNHLPIMAVLFDRALVDNGVRFDGSLDLFEDWDFWLQVSRHTPFVRVPGVSAVYRADLGRSVATDEAAAGVKTEARRRLLRKWLDALDPADVVDIMAAFGGALSEARRAGLAETELRDTLETERRARAVEKDVTDEKLASSAMHIESLQQTLAAIRGSLSWRVTAPLRKAIEAVRGGKGR